MVWSPATIESYKVARVLFPSCSTIVVLGVMKSNNYCGYMHRVSLGYFVYERTYFLTFMHVHACT